jgi:hypothetical protein
MVCHRLLVEAVDGTVGFRGGQYVLRAHDGKLCLDDSDISARNGTQLIVSRCSNSAGQ